MTDPMEPIKLKVTAQQHEWIKKWAHGFHESKIHKSRRKLVLVPPEEIQAGFKSRSEAGLVLPPSGSGGVVLGLHVQAVKGKMTAVGRVGAWGAAGVGAVGGGRMFGGVRVRLDER